MLKDLINKESKLVIGLMSGTSADGIDAVLVRITGHGPSTKVKQLAFISPAYSEEVRARILTIAEGKFGGAKELCLMNALLGHLFADTCLKLCAEAGVDPSDIDLVGSHGQTVWHIPAAEDYLGYSMRGTLQIGDPSEINEKLGCTVVSDFRVRDMAAGGLGAPLVPYTEYILYSDPDRNVGLQNIGGIGNITILPKGGKLSDLSAVDTGPGNMIMDNVISRLTKGQSRYDKGGSLALKGQPSSALLSELMQDPYLQKLPPKTTGREYFGDPYVDKIMKQAEKLVLSPADLMATVTMFTASSIAWSVDHLCAVRPDRLIVGGGGAQNPVLMDYIRQCLPDVEVMRNEDLGLDGDAKEAVAFALLANEAIYSQPNNAPAATGASHPVVMGKISQ